ncbi:MAG: TonB-dependent receptor [Pseudomonadota bacterium]|nr:TonB-dependent receptor [Pseudomonadota bacterium]
MMHSSLKYLATFVLSTLLIAPLPAFADNDLPFAISFDGKKVDSSADIKRVEKMEAAELDGVDIQVKFDGLGVRPILNVSTFPMQMNFRSADKIRFLASYNYEAWVKKTEIKIYVAGNSQISQPMITIPVASSGAAEWVMPDNAPAEMEYVLRVYDKDNRYDETRPLLIKHSDTNLPLPESAKDVVAPGYGEDRTAIRNISVFGGAVTVIGKKVPKNHDVRVMGEVVPVDGNDSFVVQKLLPPGAALLDVSVLQDGKGLHFSREVVVPEYEWFGVGIADLTVGNNFGNGIVEHTGVDEFPGTWAIGRAAFYLKGKIKGQYILTASADTGEGTLADMFTGIGGKDPRSMIKRINANDYYPVYGDDSTLIEDAPTSGKIYVRLERGPSSIMWGNFKTNITGTKFMAESRALYGAGAVYRSDAVTVDGNAKRSVDAYAALPKTVPETDVFRGTGGSAYFMRHSDITAGSDVVSVEVRNPITGFVISTQQLTPTTDYHFDPTNGVLILNSALSSNDISGNENYLIAHYTYEPVATDSGAYVFGGRVETWLNDHVRVGATGLREKQNTADQTMGGADVHIQSSPKTFVEGEVAHSEGPGFGSTYSVNGGISTLTTPGAGVTGVPANGWRVEGAADLDEVTKGKAQGQVQGRLEHYDAGFSSPSTQTTVETIKWGVAGDVKVKDDVAAKAEYSENNAIGQSLLRSGKAAVDVVVTKGWTVEPYAKYTEQEGTALVNTQSGARGDVGVKLIRDFDRDHQAYVFGQGTVAIDGTMLSDDRAGVGYKGKINDRLTAAGEVSYGDQGPDVKASLDFARTADDHYTLGYNRNAYRSSAPGYPYLLNGSDLGTITLGDKRKFNNQWSGFAETSYDYFGARQSLANAYGVSYTPDDKWKIDAAAQVGQVYDYTINTGTGLKNPNIYRDALSVSAVYHDKAGLDGKAKGEVRWDYADNDSSEIMSYLLQLGLGYKMNKDWRALANLDLVWSDASNSTLSSALINGTVGFAYRPADNDRVNALVKTNFVYDAPGSGQVTLDGTTTSPQQISLIFSGDVNYNVTEKLTLGGKLGYRIGEELDRSVPGAVWTPDAAYLGIVRADYHVVKAWDVLAEARMLWSPTGNSTDIGFVAAIYRQVGENFKLGLGYNFGTFSDNLAQIAHDNHGVFVNMVGSF